MGRNGGPRNAAAIGNIYIYIVLFLYFCFRLPISAFGGIGESRNATSVRKNYKINICIFIIRSRFLIWSESGNPRTRQQPGNKINNVNMIIRLFDSTRDDAKNPRRDSKRIIKLGNIVITGSLSRYCIFDPAQCRSRETKNRNKIKIFISIIYLFSG